MFRGECTTCGARLIFVPTKAGREMPCESEPVELEQVKIGLRYAVKRPGEGCEIKSGADVLVAADAFSDDAVIYIPHWGNCNAPARHRRRRR